MMHAPFAYLGPGSGFAFLGSFLTVLLSLLASFLSLLLWPFRMVWGMARGGRATRRARVRRLVFLDFIGLDPEIAEKLMAEGGLPNLARMKEQGTYGRLRGDAAPVWPAPLWQILKRNGVDSTILRMPQSFATDDFAGRRLFAAPGFPAAPGGFSLFTRKAQNGTLEGGTRYPLVEVDGVLLGELVSGDKPIPFRVMDAEGDTHLEIDGESYPLKPHKFTSWIRLKFGAVHGIVRFLPTKTGPEFSLYVTAVQIDPEKPAIPISQPDYYAKYLAKLLGTFSTSDMAETRSALQAGVIDEEDFAVLARLRRREQEAIFFSALDHQPRGIIACVFDAPEPMYSEVDRLIGKALEHADNETAIYLGIENLAPTALGLLGISIA